MEERNTKDGYILTYSGKRFYPLEPQADMLELADIAHALSMMTRANGHFPVFHSVAEHCIECAEEAALRGYSKRVVIGCLLHDASEAYLADITRPVKKSLPQYIEAENRLLELIYETYIGGAPLSEEERSRIKEIDDAMLYHEFQHFMGIALTEEAPELVSSPEYPAKTMQETEREYLQMYAKWISQTDKGAAV